MFKKIILTQGKHFPRAMLPQIHWTWGMVRNTWPYQVSIPFWFQTSLQKLPTLWACRCKLTNGICLTHLVLFILCDMCDVIFSSWSCVLLLFAIYFILTMYINLSYVRSHVFCYIFYINRRCKASCIMEANLLHLSVVWYFSTLLLFYDLIICIAKQMYNNVSVCSLHTCEITHSSTNIMCLCFLSPCLSLHWLLVMVLKVVLQVWWTRWPHGLSPNHEPIFFPLLYDLLTVWTIIFPQKIHFLAHLLTYSLTGAPTAQAESLLVCKEHPIDSSLPEFTSTLLVLASTAIVNKIWK